MPETKVKRPDGSIVTVKHPEGAGKEQIFKFASQYDGSTEQAPVEKEERFGENVYRNPFAAQFGKAATKEDPIGLPEFITGASRGRYQMSELPELTQTNPGLATGAKIVATMLAIPDQEERAKALNSLGIKVDRDENGNQIATLPDNTKAVLNKPGLSRADFLELGSTIAKYAPAARIAGLGRSVLGKMGLGFLATGATSAVEEKTQEALGGDFDNEDIIINSALGAGAEAILPIAKAVMGGVSPAVREAILTAKTADDLRAAGIPQEELSQMAEKMTELQSGAKKLNVRPPMRAETMPEGSLLGETVRADVRIPSGINPELANQVATDVKLRTSELKSGLERSFRRFPAPDQLQALEGARKTAKEIVDAEVDATRGFANIMYDDAFEGAAPVDVKPIRQMVDYLIERAPSKSPTETKLKNIKQQLLPKQYSAEVDELAATLMAEKSKLASGSRLVEDFNGAIRAAKDGNFDSYMQSNPSLRGYLETVGVDVPQVPPMEMSPQTLQEVNWYLRDLKKVQTDSSIAGAAKTRARQIEQEVTASLDIVTGGKYSAADQRYAQMMQNLDRLVKSKIGKAADMEDITIDRILSSVFNPKPSQQQLSVDFMRQLRTRSPDAADDLYHAYFASQIENLPQEAKASDVLKAVYGKSEDAKNMVARLAPDEATRRRLMLIRDQLESATTFEDVSVRKAAERLAEERTTSGILPLFGKIFTPGFSARHGLEGMTQKGNVLTLFDAAVNDEWGKRLDEIIRIYPTRPEVAEFSLGEMMRVVSKMPVGGITAGEAARASVQELNR